MRELALVAFLSQKMEHPFSFRRVTLKSQDQSECATPVKLLAQHNMATGGFNFLVATPVICQRCRHLDAINFAYSYACIWHSSDQDKRKCDWRR